MKLGLIEEVVCYHCEDKRETRGFLRLIKSSPASTPNWYEYSDDGWLLTSDAETEKLEAAFQQR